MKNENVIKRATSTDVQEERKQRIKAFRSVLYNRLDNKNAFTREIKNDGKNDLIKGIKNGKTQTR